MKWRCEILSEVLPAPETGNLFSEALGSPARVLQMNCLVGFPETGSPESRGPGGGEGTGVHKGHC